MTDRPDDLTTRVADWFAQRLPAHWTAGSPQIELDREEILVVLPRPDDSGRDDFRGRTREERIALARAAEEKFGRKVSWAMLESGACRLFTTVRSAITTQLAMPERRVLDTLVAAGVATDRSDAVAWCIRLVGQHEGDWLGDLRDATAAGQRAERPTQF